MKKRPVLGGKNEQDKEVANLGRVVRWTDGGIEFEADANHRKTVMAKVRIR